MKLKRIVTARDHAESISVALLLNTTTGYYTKDEAKRKLEKLTNQIHAVVQGAGFSVTQINVR